VLDARVFRQIAVGEMDMRKLCLGLLVDAPADHAHLGRVSEASTPSRNLVLLVSTMNEIMARLTQGNEVIGTIPASLAGLAMMDVQNGVFRRPLTPLAGMLIAKQHVLADIPEAELWSFLILFPLNCRILDLLQVELGHLNDGLAHR